jgi:hypothetical protein
VFAQRERELLEERKKKVEAKKRAEVEKKAEVEKQAEGKKQGREDLVGVTVGSMMVEDGVTWNTKEGKVCEGCEKADKKCFWRDSAWAKACHNCHTFKKMCVVGPGNDKPGITLSVYFRILQHSF